MFVIALGKSQDERVAVRWLPPSVIPAIDNVHYYVFSTPSPVASHYFAAMGVLDYFTAFSAKFWERLRFPSKFTRDLVWGIILGITVSLSSTSAALILQEWRRKRAIQRIPPRPIELRSDEIVSGVTGLIGSCCSFADSTCYLILRDRQHTTNTYKFIE